MAEAELRGTAWMSKPGPVRVFRKVRARWCIICWHNRADRLADQPWRLEGNTLHWSRWW